MSALRQLSDIAVPHRDEEQKEVEAIQAGLQPWVQRAKNNERELRAVFGERNGLLDRAAALALDRTPVTLPVMLKNNLHAVVADVIGIRNRYEGWAPAVRQRVALLTPGQIKGYVHREIQRDVDGSPTAAHVLARFQQLEKFLAEVDARLAAKPPIRPTVTFAPLLPSRLVGPRQEVADCSYNIFGEGRR